MFWQDSDSQIFQKCRIRLLQSELHLIVAYFFNFHIVKCRKLRTFDGAVLDFIDRINNIGAILPLSQLVLDASKK